MSKIELIRTYIKMGFNKVPAIKSDDVDRIVNRYLTTNDSLDTIAREEANNIRRNRIYGVSVDSAVIEEVDDSSVYRALAFNTDRSESPRRPSGRTSSLGTRYILQKKDEEEEEFFRRKEAEKWKGHWIVTAILLFATNVAVALVSVKVDEPIMIPYGFIALIPFIFTYRKWRKKEKIYRQELHSRLNNIH